MNFGLFSRIRSYSRQSPMAYFAAVYATTAAFQKGFGFLLFLWFARTLQVGEYASFGLLYALQAGLATLAGAGIVEAVIGGLKDHHTAELRARLFGGANAVFLRMAAVATLVTAVIYWCFPRESARSLFDFVCVVLSGGMSAFFAMQAYLVRLDENHRASLALNFLAPFAGLLFGSLLFFIFRTVTSFFAGLATGLVLSALILRLRRVGHFEVSNQPQATRPILSQLAPFIAIGLLTWLAGYGSTYLVSVFFSTGDVAKFAFLYTVSAVMELIATALNQVWSPRFFRLVSEHPLAEVESKNRQFFALQGLAMGITGMGLLVILPPAIRFAGGNLAAYGDMRLELLLLVAAYVVSIPYWHAQNYFYFFKRGDDLMRVTLYSSAAGLLLWFAAVWLLGARGIYVGFLARMLGRSVLAVILGRKHWPIILSWEGPAIALVLLLGGFALASLWL